MNFLLLLLILALAGCSSAPKQDKVQAASKTVAPMAVETAAVETRRVERSILVTGSLLPDETVAVSSEVAGRVSKILVDFGQSVRQGDVVAELDKREYQLQVERARASLQQALARLGLEPGQEDRAPTSTPAMRQATAQLEDAKFKFESAAKLVATGDISRDRYNELEKNFRAREAALEAMRDEMRTQWASVQALRAEVKLAEKRFNDATMRAPFDGAVAAKLVSPGQYIKENTPVVSLVKTFPLRLRLEVPEKAAGAVRAGTGLDFVTDAIPGETFRATVRELNPTLDARSRSLTAEARIVSGGAKLRPGMFAQVRLVVERDTEIVVAPKAAIYNVAGLYKMFVIRDGKAVECRVPPGQTVGDFVEAPADLVKPGEQVAVSGLARLVDGAPVTVTARKS